MRTEIEPLISKSGQVATRPQQDLRYLTILTKSFVIFIFYEHEGSDKRLHVQHDEGPCTLHGDRSSCLEEGKKYKCHINDDITSYTSYTSNTRGSECSKVLQNDPFLVVITRYTSYTTNTRVSDFPEGLQNGIFGVFKKMICP